MNVVLPPEALAGAATPISEIDAAPHQTLKAAEILLPSLQRGMAIDAAQLRSARATPAPPVVMAGYSARLALSTTVSGMLFAAVGLLPFWRLSVLLALAMVCWSGWRLVRVSREWAQPEIRARVVVTVAS